MIKYFGFVFVGFVACIVFLLIGDFVNAKEDRFHEQFAVSLVGIAMLLLTGFLALGKLLEDLAK